MIELGTLIFSAIFVLLGIPTGLWLARIAEEELQELEKYLNISIYIVIASSLVVTSVFFYIRSESWLIFPAFALMFIMLYILKTSNISTAMQYLFVGVSFSIASLDKGYFPVTLLSFIFMVMSTSLVYLKNIREKKYMKSAIMTVKSSLFCILLFLMSLFVRVWYSG